MTQPPRDPVTGRAVLGGAAHAPRDPVTGRAILGGAAHAPRDPVTGRAILGSADRAVSWSRWVPVITRYGTRVHLVDLRLEQTTVCGIATRTTSPATTTAAMCRTCCSRIWVHGAYPPRWARS